METHKGKLYKANSPSYLTGTSQEFPLNYIFQIDRNCPVFVILSLCDTVCEWNQVFHHSSESYQVAFLCGTIFVFHHVEEWNSEFLKKFGVRGLSCLLGERRPHNEISKVILKYFEQAFWDSRKKCFQNVMA